MSDWKTELDALVAETMDFARQLRSQPPASIKMPEPTRSASARLEPMNWGGSEREEIQRRVASFKAHQQFHARQREAFAAAQWKRTLAARTFPGAES